MSIQIIQGSILDFEGDCIVNPANNHLNHGGGLARAIDDAARFDLDSPWQEERAASVKWIEDNAAAPLVPTGGAYATSAGALPYKAVIHAVGPVWGGGDYCERDLLQLAHESALDLAFERKFTSIAFPAISCGIFGFPVELAAPIAVTVAGWQTDSIDVSFYIPEDHIYAAFKEVLT